MRIKILLAGLALAAGLGTAQAQEDDVWVSGRVINAPLFDAGYRLLFSQHDFIYGTARSTAMGGAFTSLGADLSSMNINPAGLGMYQSSDWGFTQALTVDRMRTTSPYMSQGTLAAGGTRTSYGLNNVGAAWNIFNSSGSVTSLTLGFSYNRAANFNSRTGVETFGENSTISDMFARQLNRMVDQGLPAEALNPGMSPWFNDDIYFEEWGAVLGLHTDAAGLNSDGEYGYWLDAIPNDSYFGSVTKGGIYEYNFSAGVNLQNKLYLGATLGLTDINFSEDTSYEEFYDQSLGSLWYDQSTVIQGSGMTAKLGVVARPVEALRIGLAFHLPTWYTLEKSYQGTMGTRAGRADTGVPLKSTQHLTTAPRLLAGISGVIADRAIVALDWDVAWYNKIGIRHDGPSRIRDVKEESQDLYRAAHTLRAGVEYLLTDAVSLRAGGSWMGDFRRVKGGLYNPTLSDNPTVRSGFSITGGAGFNIGRSGYIDMAYVYNRARMTDYEFYFYDDGDLITGQYDVPGSGPDAYDRSYTPTRNRHMITLTIGSRF